MTDKLLAILALVLFFSFVTMVIVYIKEPDLIIISVLVMAFAAFDFWRQLFSSNNGS